MNIFQNGNSYGINRFQTMSEKGSIPLVPFPNHRGDYDNMDDNGFFGNENDMVSTITAVLMREIFLKFHQPP